MPTLLRPGATLHYRDRGPRDGAAVVLLPSLLCDASMFEHLATTLESRYRVLGVDMRGHGRSTADRAFTMEEQAGDVAAILDDAGVSRAALVGLSQGGMAAIRAAFYHEPRVSALCLLDSSAEPEGLFVRTKYLAMSASFRAVGMTDALAKSVLPLMFSDDFMRRSPEIVDSMVSKWKRLDGRAGYYATANVALRTDAVPLLANIHVPTLVLVGTGDRALPPERSKLLAKKIVGAHYVEIPGAGHLSTIEQPEATTREIVSFLDALLQSSVMVPGVLEAALASVSLFDRLRADELGCVAASFELVTLAPGASRTLGGGDDARMVVVVCGKVDLQTTVAGEPSETRLEIGDRYGDVPLMTGEGRPVTLRAGDTEAVIALLDRDGMDAILSRYPAVNLPLAEELAQELARKNDHVRQILELHAAGLPEDELRAAVDERRRALARHAVRVRRLGMRALFHRFVVREGAEPPFWMLVGFLVSLAGARVVVGLILKFGLEKRLFALVPGSDPNPMHVHHFNYGLVLIALSGLAALFPFGRRALRVLAATFGFGAGLVFDEFALFWNLNPEYSQSLSLIASAMAVVVLVQLTYFRTFWGAVFRRSWHAMRGTS